jgi:hypothetical protein
VHSQILANMSHVFNDASSLPELGVPTKKQKAASTQVDGKVDCVLHVVQLVTAVSQVGSQC